MHFELSETNFYEFQVFEKSFCDILKTSENRILSMKITVYQMKYEITVNEFKPQCHYELVLFGNTGRAAGQKAFFPMLIMPSTGIAFSVFIALSTLNVLDYMYRQTLGYMYMYTGMYSTCNLYIKLIYNTSFLYLLYM